MNKQIVVETAVWLANSSGSWQTLTLTELAAALDVRVPSLYNHVQGQEGLQRELALYGLRALLTAVRHAAIAKVGQDALVAIAQAYRTFAQTYSGIYELTLQAPPHGDEEWQQLSTELVALLALILDSFGLTDDAALHAIRGLRSLLHGFVSLEMGGGFGLPLDLDASFQQMVMAYLHGVATNL